ncbi:MAG: amidohydrolase [Chitinophagales bacterium]
MKKIAIISPIILIFLFIAYQYILQDFTPNKSTIYTNAKIITVNKKNPVAEAMFIHEGKIEAIGSNQEITSLQKKGIEVVDLQRQTVMPGFIDPHTHPALSALLSEMVDLSGFKHKSNQEVWDYLQEVVANTKEGEWIVCKGIDPILVEDLKVPNIQYLDKIAPNNPVVLLAQSLHSYWANTAVFEKVGIDKQTPNPSKLSYYDKDANGNLTGLIVEQVAFKPFLETMKEEVFTVPKLTAAIGNTMKDYALQGNTTVVSTGLTINDEKSLMLFEHLSSKTSNFMGMLLEKLGFLPTRTPLPRHFIYLRHDFPVLKKSASKDDFYNIIGIKHWYDGSPYIGTMYLNEPYQTSDLTQNELHIPEGHKGKALIEKAELTEFIEEYHNKGWQIAVHTQGDAAIEEVLEVFEEVNQKVDISQGRHRLEHCLLLPESNIDQLKTLNITPSFHINHLYYYGDALKESMLGAERAEKILPIRNVQDKGIVYSLHADQPMFASRPFRLMQTAIERKTQRGNILGEKEAIERMDALKALTIDAAWQIHREDKIGSLEVGKYADFIIVDKNPFEVPVSELETIEVLKTYINGNEVK